MERLKLACFGGPNSYLVYKEIIPFISQEYDIQVELVDAPLQKSREMFARGEIHIAHMCGAEYIRNQENLELLASLTPTFTTSREKVEEHIPSLAEKLPQTDLVDFYDGPFYHSFLTVHKDAPYTVASSFEDAVCAYNEKESFSGHYAFLKWVHDNEKVFRKSIPSKSHKNSLSLILDKKVDAAMIDSTVLSHIYPEFLTSESEVRIIDTIGPSPFPPLAYHKECVEELHEEIEKLKMVLLTEDFQEILEQTGMKGFSRITPNHFDDMAAIMEKTRHISYTKQ